MPHRALIVGHFSTFGDLASMRFVCERLSELGLEYDVSAYSESVRSSLEGALEPSLIVPSTYSHFIVVCGPIWAGLLESRGFPLRAFKHCVRIGVNLTMLRPVDEWNPFDVLLERDSNRCVRVDLAFFESRQSVRVIGCCLIETQPVYGDKQRHSHTIAVVEDFFRRSRHAILQLDTRFPLQANRQGIRTSDQFMELLGRCDLVITNRLHGLVYAQKVGVPVIAIDSVSGGDKVQSQARVLGVNTILSADTLTVEVLSKRVDSILEKSKVCVSQDNGEIRELERRRARDDLIEAIRLKPDKIAIERPDEFVDPSSHSHSLYFARFLRWLRKPKS
jgi:hypothetical protein